MIIIKTFDKSVFFAYAVLLVALIVALSFGRYASDRQAAIVEDTIVGYSYPVRGEGGGGVSTPTSGVSTFTFFVYDPSSGATGNAFCLNHGYTTCVTGGTQSTVYLYQSTDLSCTTMQSEDYSWTPIDCGEILTTTPMNESCFRTTSPAFSEPFYGDYSAGSKRYITCAR